MEEQRIAEATGKALARIGDRRAVPPLIEALEACKKGAWDALQHFAKNGWSPANEKEEIYFLMVSDRFDLAVNHGIGAIDPLIAALRYFPMGTTDSHKVRDALASIGVVAVDRLIPVLLDGSNWNGQFGAADILAKIGDSRAVPALIEVLHVDYSRYDLVINLGRLAKDALEKITGMGYGYDQNAWKKWWGVSTEVDLSDQLHAPLVALPFDPFSATCRAKAHRRQGR